MTRPIRVLLITLLILIWGSTWLVIKVGLEDLPPFTGAGLRFALAAIVLFGLGRAQRVPFPRSRTAHFGLVGIGLGAFALSYRGRDRVGIYHHDI